VPLKGVPQTFGGEIAQNRPPVSVTVPSDAVVGFEISPQYHRSLDSGTNTLRTGLIQAVRKKTADSHVALRGNFSAPVCSTDPVKVSKNAASLVD